MDTLDKIDIEILRHLQENGRLTTKELALKVHLSTTPVYERQKRLEREGYIQRYVAVIDADKLNRGFTVFCSVKLHPLNKEIANNFCQKIKAIPEVVECYNISGKYDYMMKICAPDMKYYQQFVLNELGMIDSIGAIESTFVMDHIKYEIGIPLETKKLFKFKSLKLEPSDI